MGDVKDAWRRMARTRDTSNPKNTVSNYNSYEEYESDIVQFGHLNNAPTLAAQRLLKHLGKMDSNVKILDVGAGTGFVGEALRQNRFQGTLHAIDGSELMLEKAKSKHIYDDIVCQYLDPDFPINEPLDYFDGIISVAAFSQGYVHFNVIKNLVKVLAPGGVLVIVFSRFGQYQDYQNGLEECFRNLENEKVLRRIEVKLIDKYFTVNYEKGKEGFPTAMLYSYYKITTP